MSDTLPVITLLLNREEWLRKFDMGDTAETCERIIDELKSQRAEIERLRVVVEQCSEALNVVATGIWRDKRNNTCGLTGASVAVHAVKFARKAIRAAEAAKEK